MSKRHYYHHEKNRITKVNNRATLCYFSSCHFTVRTVIVYIIGIISIIIAITITITLINIIIAIRLNKKQYMEQ